MKKLITILLLIFSLTLLKANESDTKSDSTKTGLRRYHLEGIKVVGEAYHYSVKQSDVKYFSENTPIVDVDLGESIDLVKGVEMTEGGKSGKTLSIRGFGNKHVKLLVDGRPLSAGYFDNLDFSTIPIPEVKEIRVMKGPVASVYGVNTMGGVINIITKSPSNKSWLKLSSQLRRNNTYNLSISSSRSFDKWDYWLSISRFNTDGMILSDKFEPTSVENGEVLNNSAKSNWDFQSRINYSLFDFHTLTFQFGYTDNDKKEIPYGVSETIFRQFIYWKRFQGSVSAYIQAKYNMSLESAVFCDIYNDRYAEYKDKDMQIMYSSWPSDIDNKTLGFRNKMTHDFEQFVLYYGINYENQSYSRIGGSGYVNRRVNNHSDYYNVFLQSDIPVGAFTVSAGTGFSGFRVSSDNKWISHFEPSLQIFTKTDKADLSLGYSRNTKYPSLHELFSNSSGNPDLKEEYADKFEFNQSFFNSFYGLSLSITNSLFYNEINNLIDKSNDMYQNIGKIYSWGDDISLKLKYFVEMEINYSHLNYLDKSEFKQLHVPKNSLKIATSYNLKNFILSYSWEWKDKRESEDNITLKSYEIHSADLSYRYNKYKILLGLRNIFDEIYYETYEYPGKGFDYIFAIELEI
ncbi:MAG: TonB-dependent receptor plug domain-containing protein [Candidatus Cloacimonetes bacterium]|nr:TonB-dependent receptor plug domain-containing protein [Candidatus Cloacimonadota bacterium]